MKLTGFMLSCPGAGEGVAFTNEYPWTSGVDDSEGALYSAAACRASITAEGGSGIAKRVEACWMLLAGAKDIDSSAIVRCASGRKSKSLLET
jgi:hypothetical protein